MRVLILAPGSLGDVAPATGLAAALLPDGHHVTIVGNADHQTLVENAGAAFVPITVDDGNNDRGEDGGGDSDAAGGRLDAGASGVRESLRVLRTYMDAAASAALTAAAQKPDVVIANAISPYGHDIAEALGATSFDALLQPARPSAAYPPMIASSRNLGAVGNRWAGRLAQAVPTPYDPACARVRRELGLPPRSRKAAARDRRRAGRPVHHGISPALLPRPADWPPELSLDGFWWPHEAHDWTPPDTLLDFLDAGPPPVVVSLGSHPAGERAVQALGGALRSTGLRAIVQNTSGIDAPDVLHVGHVPHRWLLPRAATLVHHGGLGTTAASLRAGVPSVTMPIHTDQPFWSAQLAALGAGTTPIPAATAASDPLAAALRATSGDDSAHRAEAQALAHQLGDEDGTRPVREHINSL